MAGKRPARAYHDRLAYLRAVARAVHNVALGALLIFFVFRVFDIEGDRDYGTACHFVGYYHSVEYFSVCCFLRHILSAIKLCESAGNVFFDYSGKLYVAVFTPCNRKKQGA